VLKKSRLPCLEPGDHLDQRTFHERYEATPEKVKAELIGGVVHMPAASMARPHGRHHSLLVYWLVSYQVQTPGVEVYDNTTTIMSEDSEPQPDASLIILPDCGGQLRFTDDDYLEGAPELAAEIASSTESYDLHSKKRDYERVGVREYLVVALRQRRIFWFRNRDGRFEEAPPDSDGIYRSAVFPGLWMDCDAFLELNGRQISDVLQQGLATAEHASFIARLANRPS
jgi:Uma2 family endonuclease